jgi:outer membrane protein
MQSCCPSRTGAARLLLLSALLVAQSLTGVAQQPARPMKLNEAVDIALANYPSIRVSMAQAAAASEGIGLARTAYLPRTDLLWQENRATSNNVFGTLLPQSIIPPISGPVLGTKSFDSVWGSACGMLFSWEPFDFGVRKANVNVARALTNRANAGVEITRLDVAVAGSDAFLAVVAADQTVRAAQANVDRMETFAKSVHVLVDNQLRPGADASRADAELAAARIQLIQTQQNAEVTRATLAEALGAAGTRIDVDAGPLLDLPDTAVPTASFDSHPVALSQAATIETVRAREQVLDRSYFPRFSFQTLSRAGEPGTPLTAPWSQARDCCPKHPTGHPDFR